MSVTDEIKAKIDIVDLVSEAGVKLRHTGKNYTGFCPFHDNKHTPAFVVWPESGTWRCFGQCNEGGDIFKFVMKREGLDFKDALQKLALRAGVEVKEYQRESPQLKEAYDHLRQLLEDAVVYYRSQLFERKDILTYLREKRGLTDASIETFGLGYAPAGYDHALKYFTQRGYAEQDLIDSGMLSVREDDGRVYDRFRNRIMIPIRDEQGRMAGFGARIVDPNDVPKFLNSPETPIFSKGRLLYGFDRARKPIRAADQAVIVEGYLDVIALHQAGYENVVSPMGTALTEDQLRMLKRITRRIVLALDPDVAGQKAILRGLDAARSAMDREGELGFDARGLLKNEARLQADLRVAALPDELDPDEIVARDKDEWKRIIENAKPIVTHVMETLAAGQNLNDAKVKSDIISRVIPLINDLPNLIERDTYSQQLARLLHVNESIFSSLNTVTYTVKKKKLFSERPSQLARITEADVLQNALSGPRRKLETVILAILLEQPDLIHRLNRFLQESGLTHLNLEDFGYTDCQELFQAVSASAQQDVEDAKVYISNKVRAPFSDLYDELLRHPEIVPESERLLTGGEAKLGRKPRTSKVLLDKLSKSAMALRRLIVQENIEQLNAMKVIALETGEDNIVLAYTKQIMQNMSLIHKIEKADSSLTKSNKE
jgi:DNA primase